MNHTDPTSVPQEPADTSAVAGDGDAPTAKPARKRAPRKAKVATAPELLPVDGTAVPSLSDIFGHSNPSSVLVVPLMQPLMPSPVPDAAGPIGPSTDNLAQPLRADANLTAASTADSTADSTPAAETPSADEGPTEAGSERRSRNRKRGRRRGERGGAEGAAVDPEGPSLASDGMAAQAGSRRPAAAQVDARMVPRLPIPEAGEVFARVVSGAYDGEAAADDAAAVVSVELEAAADAALPPLPERGQTQVEGKVQGSVQGNVQGNVQGQAASEDRPAELDGVNAGVVHSPDLAPGSAPDPRRRVLAPDADAPKLHKVLAQAGVGSRRDLEQMIIEGRVTVNGAIAHTGQRISFGDRIQLDGKPVRYRIAPPPPRVLAYHKPVGEVVTHDDPQQRPTVFRRLPRLPHGKWQSVGRLDINTEGLLLFTNSGELANQLMHPRFGVEREYAVRSLGVLSVEEQQRLLEGVLVDGQPASFKSIEDGGGEGVNHWYRVVITEGRHREVRRLFEVVGHAVSRLIRIRYGCVVLPRGLKRGAWVDLMDDDLRNLRRLASGPRPAAAGMPGPAAEGAEPGAVGKRNRKRRGRRGEDRPLDGDAGRQVDAGPRGQDRGPDRGPNRNRHGGADGLPYSGPNNSPHNSPHNGPNNGPNNGPRPPRGERPPRGPRAEVGEGGVIPSPLQQTFDKRAIQLERQRRPEIAEDGPIPNPLQQTFDKRALQRDRQMQREIPEDGPIPNPLQQTYDKRFAQAAKGSAVKRGSDGDPEQIPDPMQTSVGYIGGDAMRRKRAGASQRGGQNGGPHGGPNARGGRRAGGGGAGRGPGAGQPQGPAGGPKKRGPRSRGPAR